MEAAPAARLDRPAARRRRAAARRGGRCGRPTSPATPRAALRLLGRRARRARRGGHRAGRSPSIAPAAASHGCTSLCRAPAADRRLPRRARRGCRDRGRAAGRRRPGWSSCSPTSATEQPRPGRHDRGDRRRRRRRRDHVRRGAGPAAPRPRGPRCSSTPTRWERGSTACSGSSPPTGIRWDAMAQPPVGSARARCGEALPRAGRSRCCRGRSTGRRPLQAFAVREVLSAGRRGFDGRGRRPAAPPRRRRRGDRGALRPRRRWSPR